MNQITAEQETLGVVVDQENETELQDPTLVEPQVDDEVVVSIGEAPPPPVEEAKAPEWVRELRKKNREDTKKIKELEEKLKATQVASNPTEDKEPELADFDFDTDLYKVAMKTWFKAQEAKDEVKRAAARAEAESASAWQTTLDSYAKAKTELKVKDMDEAEADFLEIFDPRQQALVLDAADGNSALVVYALGKNPEQARKLAAIQNPIKFVAAVTRMEGQLKVTKKSSPPPPETKVVGTGRTAGTVDSTLERLRSEAEKTGDYSKIARYKSQLRAKTT